MPRSPSKKELESTHLASGYGGWIYCAGCGENIGYLCYVTYDDFRLSYQCKCGACGSTHLSFEAAHAVTSSEAALVPIKNRLCCPADQTPLFTLLDKKLSSYEYEVVCAKCGQRYAGKNPQ